VQRSALGLFLLLPLAVSAVAGEIGTDDLRVSFMGTTGTTTASADNPAIAHNTTDDEYLIVWSGRDDSGEFEIWAQLIDGPTGTVLGSNFKISDMGAAGTQYTAREPAVAYNATSHEYLVAWWGDDNTGSLADNEWEIFGQRLTAAGAEVGTNDFRISALGPDGNTNYTAVAPPSIAWDSVNNRYLVVYSGQDSSLGSTETEAWGRLLSSDGGFLTGDEVRLSTTGPAGDTSRYAFYPDVSFDPVNQRYLVVWTGDHQADNVFEIYGQFVSAAGAEFGSDFRISDMGNSDADPAYRADRPAVAFNMTSNQYLVVWRGDDESTGDDAIEIFGQLLTAAGAETGVNDFRISDMGPAGNTSFHGLDPDVAWNSQTNEWLVVWQGDETTDNDTEIWAQRLASNGTAVGIDDFALSNMGPAASNLYWALEAAIAWGNGKYLVVWRADDDTGALVDDEWEVYGQFYTVPSPLLTTISANPEFLLPDGVSTSTITVQAKDTAGLNLTQSAGTVALFTTRGTLGAVTNHGDGTYTATLTSSLTSGTATITGTLDGVAVTDTATVAFGVAAPTNVTATATSTSAITISWTAVAGATSYDVYRASPIPGYTLVGSTASTSFNNALLTANTTYVYIVRAAGASGTSPFSSPDAATTIVFTDPTLNSSILVKAAHLTQLRTAVNAMRAAAGLTAAGFTDPGITAGVTAIKAVHITQLRDALDAARTAIGLPGIGYTDPALTTGTTVKAAHFAQLRQGTQ
jgi:hypothetical protein